ncbi:MAG: AAA family ATPase [Candidatus Binataceae bacterium]|nr:AAA family ATPase [Candidatus Binataceae bacterium]
MPEIPHPSDSSPPDLKPAAAAEQLKASELRGAIPISPEELSRIAADGGPSAGDDLLGQERALDAIKLAIGINAPGYNVYVSGLRARHERETVLARLRETARTMPTPGDWVYVNNFRSAETPVAIYLKPGHGRMLRDRMRELINFVIEQLPKAFRREDFDHERAALRDKYNRQAQELFQGLEKHAREGGFAVQSAPTGQIILIPLIGGKMPESPEVLSRELEALPPAERERLDKVQSELQDELAKLLMRQQEIMRALVEDIRAIERAFAARLITPAITALKQEFENSAVQAYLDEVLDHMLGHLDRFRAAPEGRPDAMPQPPRPEPPETDGNGRFFEYQVNVLVDNSETKGAPVISEDAPSYRALFGTIERWLDPYGRAGTNFTRIIAGSFLKSHGGFLMFDLEDAIVEPGAWKTLKRSLKTGRMTLETLEPFPFFAVSGLKPEPIEISNKVIATGGAQLYNLLYFYDQDFPELFKVKAEVRPVVSADRKTIERYVRRVSELARREGLPPFDGGALTRIVEFGMRKAGDRSRMLSTMEPIDDLAREAAYFARLENSPEVRAAQVERALGDRILRLNFIEEEIRRLIEEATLIVELQGVKVGQINGLAVMDAGGYAFGRPSRVTATVALGQAGVINIEREAHLSGSSHDKGVMILSGFMRDRFGRKTPAAMTASICFEQSYSGIDGDSASSTELYALLSALSELPIRQDFAVTGSVDQHGQVQAIGGVNEKIEGFYRVCKATGLTGRQGVLIPRANVSNLMLDGETIAAVERGEFHIYPVSTIDQGIELLTGVKAGLIGEPGTINYLVNERFRAMAESLRERPYSETRVVHEAATPSQPPQPPSPPHPPR